MIELIVVSSVCALQIPWAQLLHGLLNLSFTASESPFACIDVCLGFSFDFAAGSMTDGTYCSVVADLSLLPYDDLSCMPKLTALVELSLPDVPHDIASRESPGRFVWSNGAMAGHPAPTPCLTLCSNPLPKGGNAQGGTVP